MKNIKTLWTTSLARMKEEYRKSVIVSLGLFLILLVAGFLLVSRFLSARVQSREAEAGLLIKRLEYRVALVRHKDQVEKELTGLEGNWQFMKTKIFTEASDDVAFSRIQQSLDTLATMRNIAVKSFKFESPGRIGGYSVLPVSLEFSAKYEDAVIFLNLIENHKFFLKISDLEIRCLGGDENMAVRMIVEGYRYHEKTIP
jgi:Tfp pilus assembly protein PilO